MDKSARVTEESDGEFAEIESLNTNENLRRDAVSMSMKNVRLGIESFR